MTPQTIYVLSLGLLALVLFASDRLRVDVVGLILILCLVIPRTLTPSEALAGFGSDTILVLISLFVLTQGLIRTGVVERIGLRLASLGGSRPNTFARLILLLAAITSAFVSNTVTTAMFVPLVVGAAARARMATSKLLMPLAFATILTGTITVVGTSTNLVISGQLPRYGLAPIAFFELTPVATIVAAVGLLYLLFLAPKLLPERGGGDTTDARATRRYFSEVVVGERSPLAGKTLVQVRFADVLNLIVVGIRRGARRVVHPYEGGRLEEGDELVIEGRASDILSVKDIQGVDLSSERKHLAARPSGDDERMVEALILPRSRLVGSTLRRARFKESTGLTVLAMHAPGREGRVEKLSGRKLEPSDVLLLQGRTEDFERLPRDDLLLLEDLSAHHPRRRKGAWAVSIFAGAMILGATGTMPLSMAFLTGVLVMILAGCLSPEEAYASVDWRLLVLIGSMMALGTAMEKSGASSWLADKIVQHVSAFGPYAVMAAFYLLTVVLSQPMSNQAAALVVLPVAIAAAGPLHLNPRTLALAVTMGASCSFLTPLEPACLLVYGPGRYRFFDYLKVGAPLTLMVFVLTMLLVPVFWPLNASS